MDATARYFSGPGWDTLMAGPVVWPANSTLVRQDMVPTTIYVLDEGTIKMVHVTDGGDERTIDLRNAPALVGVPFALIGRPSSIEVTTVSRCSLRLCSATALIAASASNPALGADMLGLHAVEIADLCDRAVAMSLKTSGQRLSHFMARHGSAAGEPTNVRPLPFKQSLVASIINVTPEHLSRLMKKMKATRLESTEQGFKRSSRGGDR
jgi:CRP-like cAMP-binding protein